MAVGLRDKLNIFGGDFDTKDGTGCRDYVHVEDLASGHVSAINQILSPKSTLGLKIYNLGTGRGYTVLEVVAAFEKVIGKLFVGRFADDKNFVPGKKIKYSVCDRRPGDVATCFAAIDKAREELEFTAVKTLDQMCKFYIRVKKDER